jgi:hypothetical protein
MSDGKSLIDLSKLSEPATVLIEKISNAVGIIYEPTRIVKLAQAQAHVELIKYNNQRTLSELEKRAALSLIEKEVRKQENIENITAHAIKALPENSTPNEVSDDWLSYFFSHCETVSDSDMQRVWGELLARESDRKRSFSKKTISILSTLERSDAEDFVKFCQFRVNHGSTSELAIFSLEDSFYREYGVNFGIALHLQSLGLVHYSETGFAISVSKELEVAPGDEDHYIYKSAYFNTELEYSFPIMGEDDLSNDNPQLSTGCVNFTEAGQAISRICDVQPNPKFIEYYGKALRKRGIKLTSII